MNRAVLGLGSNLGDRKKNLEQAAVLLADNGSLLLKESSVYETEPWGNKDQPVFYNQVVEIETTYNASALMTLILEIEKQMGRIRKEKWEPRVIDIDILFFNDEIISTENLTVPHPHLHERKFVLIPLKEILPNYIHPVFKKTVSEIFNQLKESSIVNPVVG
jgi:2-amino-4-hydroxy-6-hydroxymethyldihydropteridine diphosphokinase